MNLSQDHLIRISEPLATTVSSPKLDLIQLAWEHIAERHLRRIRHNRILLGRVRAVRLLAVHDAVHSVIDPGNGHIYREISEGSTLEAAFAAAAQASHDVLASVFSDPEDRENLAHLLEESLGLVGKEDEKEAGAFSGAESARAYLKAFAPLLLDHAAADKRRPVQRQWEPALASHAA